MDLHLQTTLKVFQMTEKEYNDLPESMRKKLRYIGKNINYMSLYPSVLYPTAKTWLQQLGVL